MLFIFWMKRTGLVSESSSLIKEKAFWPETEPEQLNSKKTSPESQSWIGNAAKKPRRNDFEVWNLSVMAAQIQYKYKYAEVIQSRNGGTTLDSGNVETATASRLLRLSAQEQAGSIFATKNQPINNALLQKHKYWFSANAAVDLELVSRFYLCSMRYTIMKTPTPKILVVHYFFFQYFLKEKYKNIKT